MIFRLVLIVAMTSVGYAQQYSTNEDPRLAAYLEKALERNPIVRESFARYRASQQRLPQVSSLPDPVFGVTQYLRNPETRVGPQTTMLSISQKFPWFGKRGDKEGVAAKEAAVVMQKHETRKLELVRQVKLAYYSLAYIDRAIGITREDLSVLEHYESLAQSRYSQGIGLQQAVIKLQAEMTRDHNRLEALRSQRVDGEAALNSLMDLPAYSPVGPITLTSATLPGTPQSPGQTTSQVLLDQLYKQARDSRPEVTATLLKIERDEKRIQLARKDYWPDFTVGAGFVNVLGRRDPGGRLIRPDQNGKNVWSLSFGMNIPIRRRKYDAAILEATESKIASREEYRNVVNTIEASIRAIGFRIASLDEQMKLFEQTLLPQTEQAVRSTEAAYSTGTVGVLDLLDSERVLLDVRLGLARLMSDYMKSRTEMERAIGAPF